MYVSPRCRSHAPCGDAPVCYRAVGLLRPYRRFPEYRRTQIDAPRRGRRPRRPASAHRRIPAYSRLSLRRGRRPRRPASAHRRVPAYSRLSPRRGRRPRRPAHVSTMSPAGGIFRAPSAGHFWPQRPDNLFLYASGGHISFNSERNMEKNAAKNQRFLDFPCPIPTTVQKGSASNRLYVSPRCRSHAPRGWRAMTGSGTRR